MTGWDSRDSLYWELPMMSARRRSAQAALVESKARRVPLKAASQQELSLFIVSSIDVRGCERSRVVTSRAMKGFRPPNFGEAGVAQQLLS
jgi:hypothetical protein